MREGNVTSLRDLKVVVIGGGGFIGTHLCNALADRGARVSAFGRSRRDPGAMDPRVAWSACLISDLPQLREHLVGAEVVYHLASSTTPALSEADPAADVADNVVPTIRLLEEASRLGVARLVFVSSGGTVYGVPAAVPVAETASTLPISAHGLHKLTIEGYLALFRERHGLDSIVLRLANLYGPLQRARRSQGVVAAFLEAALRGDAIEIWGDGKVTRDFVFVDDVVEAMVLAATYQGALRVFNVGSGSGIEVNAIAGDIEAVLGRGPLRRTYRPARAVDVPVNVLDIARITAEMGWTPRISWLEGLRRTAAWMETQALEPRPARESAPSP
jgi:UDP-glucose 4-epimerase